MSVRIAFFSPKSGVGKTTATLGLGWMLASKGKRVVLADTDPQAYLTELVLGYDGLEQFYRHGETRNIQAALAPAFESRPSPIEAVDCVAVGEQDGLFLLPGHNATQVAQLGSGRPIDASSQGSRISVS